MIGKKILKKYEFKTIEEYFDYIEDSKINGQFPQVRELFKRLSKSQQKLCLNYFNNEERKEILNCLLKI